MSTKLNPRLAGLFLLVLCTAPLCAQSETGQVSGTITDPAGAIVANAKVTVTNSATNSVRTVSSNGAGIYIVTNLQPADYVLAVEMTGFAKSQQRITVPVGGKLGLDVKLEIGQTGTVVEVQASTLAVNTESQTLGGVVNSTQMVELPTLSRNPYALVATVGSVSGVTPDGRGVGFAINGQRASSTNVMLDGTANNDEFTSTVGMNVPLDSVQEFSVLTNNFTAEFGRATGGVVNVVTKSGTNQIHGTAYEFNRLSRLASNDFNSNANGLDRPVFTRNQYGYSIGGPVVRNKLFFFSSTEWTRVRSQANLFAYVPTPQLIGLSHANTQLFMKTYGSVAPGVTNLSTHSKASLLAAGVNICSGLAAGSACSAIPGDTPIWQRVSYSVPSDSGGGSPQNTYSSSNRVDYNIGEKTQMYLRYAFSGETDAPGTVSYSPYLGYNTPNLQNNTSVVYSLTRLITPSLVSQSKVDFNRFKNEQPFSDKWANVPTLYMNGSSTTALPGGNIALPGYVPFSPGSGIPFGGPQNFVQLYQDFSYLKSRHQLRFGGSYNYLRDNRTFGAYQTAGDYLGTSLPKSFDNLLIGQLRQITVAVNPQGKYPCRSTASPTADCTLSMPVGQPNFSRSNRYHDYSLYVQDAYKVTSRLTLNLGLRWEVFGTQHNKNGMLDSNYYLGSGSTFFEQIASGSLQNAPQSPIGKLWVTNMANFGPRIGAAFDVFGDGKTSLRAGYGIAYERNFGNVTFNVIQNPPNYASVSVVAGVDFPTIPISIDNLGPLAGNSGTKPLPAVTLRAVDPNIKTAYAHLYSVALEHSLGQGLLAALEYSGSAGRDQYGIANINRYGYGNFYGGIPCKPGTDGDPGTCTARLRTTQYGSINWRGNGGTSSYHSLNTRVEFRGRYGLNGRAVYTWSHAIDDLSDTFSSGVPNLGWLNAFAPSTDHGNAYFDTRHRFVLSSTWEVPAKGLNGWQKQAFAGWTLAPILLLRSGSPFAIVDCTMAYNVCPYAFAKAPAPASGDGLKATSTPNTYNYMDMGKYFDSSWYDPKTGISDVGTYPSSMVGRNSFRGPGAWNLDLGIYKSFYFGERYRLQFRAEGYNFFNHPNLENPGYQDVSSGQYVNTWYSGRRFVQLALKFLF
ncbi:MAG: carboxypeptidase regulatory-like domain-containing protein [Acidobacteria bacterium]|nr:carboxypeptidase regulatory-like domain-containing protein [Acidobacteriota bacterium]